MIVFDLRCQPTGHVFEAWFGSSSDYDDQQGRGLVSCPICGADEVEKAPMAPAVPKKGNAAPSLPADPAQVKAMMAALADAQTAALEKSDWVGDRFADEARSIHLGETDARAIHGQATQRQVRDLVEDGVPVAPLPFPVAAPGEKN